jgi:hypothetical protein
MKNRVLLSLTISLILFPAGKAFPCSVSGFGNPDPLFATKQMVAGADLIVRATAVNYAVPPANPNVRTSGISESRVRFSVEEVVKGSYTSREIILPGSLSNRDEWNPAQPPYTQPRHSAEASCFSNMYRQGGQFLLVLKRQGSVAAIFSSDTEYTVNWSPLRPVNAQLRSPAGPWLQWVREQVKMQ